jgi:DNA polymerase kappa
LSQQTGKELLLPELPLTLRLIGLRVTKLKDLVAAADPEVGIKRVCILDFLKRL